jgi:anti-anti-sigma factor
MEISVTTKDSIAVMNLEGNLDTNTSPDAQKSLDELFDSGTLKILINFTKVDFVSSSGLRILLATAKKLKDSNGELRVCSLNEDVEEIFDISGFNTIINVYATEDEAMQGF